VIIQIQSLLAVVAYNATCQGPDASIAQLKATTHSHFGVAVTLFLRGEEPFMDHPSLQELRDIYTFTAEALMTKGKEAMNPETIWRTKSDALCELRRFEGLYRNLECLDANHVPKSGQQAADVLLTLKKACHSMNQEKKEDKCEYTSEVYLGQFFLAYEVLGSVAKLFVPDHEVPACLASGGPGDNKAQDVAAKAGKLGRAQARADDANAKYVAKRAASAQPEAEAAQAERAQVATQVLVRRQDLFELQFLMETYKAMLPFDKETALEGMREIVQAMHEMRESNKREKLTQAGWPEVVDLIESASMSSMATPITRTGGDGELSSEIDVPPAPPSQEPAGHAASVAITPSAGTSTPISGTSTPGSAASTPISGTSTSVSMARSSRGRPRVND
jgi:hypothetical protein